MNVDQLNKIDLIDPTKIRLYDSLQLSFHIDNWTHESFVSEIDLK